MLRKKAPNSDFRCGPLHGEIGLLKIQILLLHISVLKLLASKISIVQKGSTHPFFPPELLAPTGALVLMMVYYIYIYLSIYPATFSDFEHLCLSIQLQVSL